MNESFDFTESTSPTVGVWTPWGVQSVRKSEGRAAVLRRAAARLRGSDELPSVPDFADRPWPVG